MNNYSFDDEEKIFSPQLVYYEDIIDTNINKIIEIAKNTSRLWPHIKTHKTKNIVKKLMDKGVTKFKCATFSECEVAAQSGASEILLAYPLVGPSLKRFIKLESLYKDTKFYGLLEDLDQAKKLNNITDHIIDIFVDVNVGLNRTGVPLNKLESFINELRNLKNLRVLGLHCYDGQNGFSDLDERQEAIDILATQIFDYKKKLDDSLNISLKVICGGTPEFPCWMKYDVFCSPGTCFVQDSGYEKLFPDIQIQPGAAVLSRVISNPTDGYFTLDCGYKAIASDPKGIRGQLVGYHDIVEDLFQNEEHWVFKMKPGYEDRCPKVGQIVYIIPTHICPTSALYAKVPVVSKGKLKEHWEISARNREINC